MRKGETLEQEAARKKAERELPGKVAACTKRADALCKAVKAMTIHLQSNHRSNEGGENSGKLL